MTKLIVDGSSRLNLATFYRTWMEPVVVKLVTETFDKIIAPATTASRNGLSG